MEDKDKKVQYLVIDLENEYVDDDVYSSFAEAKKALQDRISEEGYDNDELEGLFVVRVGQGYKPESSGISLSKVDSLK